MNNFNVSDVMIRNTIQTYEKVKISIIIRNLLKLLKMIIFFLNKYYWLILSCMECLKSIMQEN